MLGLSANLNYYLFNGNVDLRNADSKMLHIGCWTHCRGLWVDAFPSDRTAMDIIDPIGDMFRNEDLFPHNETQR